jgi:hypothetical protein
MISITRLLIIATLFWKKDGRKEKLLVERLVKLVE